MDWSSGALDLSRVERALLGTGRLRELPLLGYMDDGPVEWETLPAPVQALCQHVRAFVVLEPGSSSKILDQLRRRLRA